MVDPQGLSAVQLEQIKLILRTFLQDKKQVTVFTFGSRAKGSYQKYSDLDLWIEVAPPLTSLELHDLSDRFIESDLPIKVDVVTPDNCLDVYRDSIEKAKVPWFSLQNVKLPN